MHRLDDLILEATVNSIEAGADRVSILLEEQDGYIEVKVMDNGFSPIPDNPFEEGISSKGKERGRGLALIKERDGSASLDKCNGMTVLTFGSGDDGSFEKIEDSLFPIFQTSGNIEFSWLKSGKEYFHLDSSELKRGDAIPYNAGSIARFKAIVRGKKEYTNV